MNILITGGVGFIGTNTALYFAKNKNNYINIVDNFSRIGVLENAKYLGEKFPRINIIKTNINNVEKYRSILKKSEVIIHLAGQTAVTSSIKNPAEDFKNNLVGSFKLLEEIRVHNPKTILFYASTNKVYGNLNNHNIKKNNQKKKYEDLCHLAGLGEEESIDFISPYGCSKGSVDFYVQDYSRIYDLKTVVFRQSCVYGQHQIGVEDQGWVAHFCKQCLNKKPITIFGNGYQVRDLLFVEDLVDAYDLAIQKINKVKGKALNIGGGITNAYSLIEVLNILKSKLKTTVKINYKKERLGDQKYFVSNNHKIDKLLGWSPKTAFSDGIDKLIIWQKNNLVV